MSAITSVLLEAAHAHELDPWPRMEEGATCSCVWCAVNRAVGRRVGWGNPDIYVLICKRAASSYIRGSEHRFDLAEAARIECLTGAACQ